MHTENVGALLAAQPLHQTQTGLSVTAHLDRRFYPTGTEPTPEQLQALRIRPHEVLPKWNYTISSNL
jgi:hypothetical protein